jgi:GxxExxY protein
VRILNADDADEQMRLSTAGRGFSLEIMTGELIEKELSYQIRSAAYAVHNTLGPGFQEKIYEEALVIELQSRGLQVDKQKRVEVYYREYLIGIHVLDLVVNQRVIVEVKAVFELPKGVNEQALSYLKATKYQLALVINFGTPRVQISRVVLTSNRTIVDNQTTSNPSQ